MIKFKAYDTTRKSHVYFTLSDVAYGEDGLFHDENDEKIEYDNLDKIQVVRMFVE